MFQQLFKRDETVRRHLAAPLPRSRSDYLAHRAEQGVQPRWLQRIARALLAVVLSLKLGRAGKVPLSDIEAGAERWLAQGNRPSGRNVARARAEFVRYATDWLRFAGRLQQLPPAPRHRHAARAAGFVQYMRDERGWSAATIRAYGGRADDFLRRFCGELPALDAITLATVDRALAAKSAAGCSPVSVRLYVSALRAFLRYAAEQGWCDPHLAAAVKAPRVHLAAGLPTGPSMEEVRRLLASVAGDRPADLRDRAILLLLAVYGLRAGEVSTLRLDDVDWQAETLRVRCPKAGRTALFPLAPSVGNALVRYLREARPPRADREIFLTLKAPLRPLGTHAVSCAVLRRVRRSGLGGKRRGAHALRHAFAQRLLDEGFPLDSIAECLGHRSLDSTAIYARVDLAMLRQVADFDLGGLA